MINSVGSQLLSKASPFTRRAGSDQEETGHSRLVGGSFNNSNGIIIIIIIIAKETYIWTRLEQQQNKWIPIAAYQILKT